MRTTLALVVLIAFSACNGDSSPTGTDGPIAFTEVFRDKSSGISQQGAQVIARQDAWERVWEEVNGSRRPKLPVPIIDFDKKIVILAALGHTADSCKYVRIDDVRRSNGVLNVTISDVRSPPSCVCPPVTVQPVHIVAVPRAAAGANYSWRTLSEGQPCN